MLGMPGGAGKYTDLFFRVRPSTDLYLSMLVPAFLRRDYAECLLFRYDDLWRVCMEVQSQESRVITPRVLPHRVLALIAVLTMVGSWLAGLGLASWTDDTQPYLDAFTTVPALVAQVLLILVYREHWYLWLAVDILSVALWLRAGDYCMAAQYAFWCANCLYGLRRWKTLTR